MLYPVLLHLLLSLIDALHFVIRGRILADVQSGSQTELTASKTVVILGIYIFMYNTQCKLKNMKLILCILFYYTYLCICIIIITVKLNINHCNIVDASATT